MSCSYGPGRYDPAYEEQGQDYPIGFVRWTEQRNFEAVLDMLAAGRLDVAAAHHPSLPDRRGGGRAMNCWRDGQSARDRARVPGVGRGAGAPATGSVKLRSRVGLPASSRGRGPPRVGHRCRQLRDARC